MSAMIAGHYSELGSPCCLLPQLAPRATRVLFNPRDGSMPPGFYCCASIDTCDGERAGRASIQGQGSLGASLCSLGHSRQPALTQASTRSADSRERLTPGVCARREEVRSHTDPELIQLAHAHKPTVDQTAASSVRISLISLPPRCELRPRAAPRALSSLAAAAASAAAIFRLSAETAGGSTGIASSESASGLR